MVLVLVATSQLVLASTTDLTAWRGGGFGMFSTLDNHDQRFLRITATTAEGEEVPVRARVLLAADSPIHADAVRARANPTPRNLDALGVAVADVGLIVVNGVATLPDPDEAEGEDQAGGDDRGPPLGAVTAVEIVVWRHWFDRDTSTSRPELIVARDVRP